MKRTKPLNVFQSPIGSKARSSTSHTIGSGVKTFTLDVDDGTFRPDYAVEITVNGEPDVFMYGVIANRGTSTSPVQVTVLVSRTSALVGTYSEWTLRIIAGPFLGKNYVDNPSFNNWQRATSFTIASATPTVVADRWKFRRGATGATISRQTGFSVTSGVSAPKYCLRIARDNATSATTVMRLAHQLHEFSARGLAGQYVTVSFDLRAGANYSGGVVSTTIYTGTGGDQAFDLSLVAPFATGSASTLVSNSITPTTTAQRVMCDPLLLGTSVADLAVLFQWTPSGTAGAADNIEITNVKLEIGDVATPFQPPDEAADLVACQYSFRPIGIGMSGAAQSTTSVALTAIVSPPMRVAPTATIVTISGNNFTVLGAGAATKTSSGSTVTASTLADRYIQITIDGFTGLTSGAACSLAASTQSTFTLDSELLT